MSIERDDLDKRIDDLEFRIRQTLANAEFTIVDNRVFYRSNYMELSSDTDLENAKEQLIRHQYKDEWELLKQWLWKL